MASKSFVRTPTLIAFPMSLTNSLYGMTSTLTSVGKPCKRSISILETRRFLAVNTDGRRAIRQFAKGFVRMLLLKMHFPVVFALTHAFQSLPIFSLARRKTSFSHAVISVSASSRFSSRRFVYEVVREILGTKSGDASSGRIIKKMRGRLCGGAGLNMFRERPLHMGRTMQPREGYDGEVDERLAKLREGLEERRASEGIGRFRCVCCKTLPMAPRSCYCVACKRMLSAEVRLLKKKHGPPPDGGICCICSRRSLRSLCLHHSHERRLSLQ